MYLEGFLSSDRIDPYEWIALYFGLIIVADLLNGVLLALISEGRLLLYLLRLESVSANV